MTEDQIDRILDAFGDVAAQLEEGAGYAWEIMVTRMIYEGIVLGVIAVAVGLIAAIFIRRIHQHAQKVLENEHKPKVDREDDATFTRAVAWFVTLIATVVFVLIAREAFLRLLTPEYEALRRLLESI